MVAKLFQKYASLLGHVFSLIAFALAIWLLTHEFQNLDWANVRESLLGFHWTSIAAACGFTILSYAVLIGYDWLAVRYVGRELSFRRVAKVSLLNYTFSNSLGTLLGGTPIRVRNYHNWGFSPSEIVKLFAFIGITFWMGLIALTGGLFVLAPLEIPESIRFPVASTRPIGWLLLAIAGTYALVCWASPKRFKFWGTEFQTPKRSTVVAQFGLACADLICASACLYVLLPKEVQIGFLSFTSIFVLAIVVSLISHVPGGAGVLEYVLISFLPETSHQLVASLLAFRIIYYLVPLILGMGYFAVDSLFLQRTAALDATRKVVNITTILAPKVITVAVFCAGLVLLVSGSLPSIERRIFWLKDIVPLPAIEISHLIGSIVGVLLLVLARALQRRIDVAWHATVILLVVGILVSLLKGFDYEEATILGVLLLVLLPAKKYFNRSGHLWASRFDWTWWITIAISIALVCWLFLFSYSHEEYRESMWWEFAWKGNAPRSMRATFGAAVLLIILFASALLRSAPKPPPIAKGNELDEIQKLVDSDPSTNANLALLGDKRFIFSEDRRAAVMFGCEGRSWIAMGDPIGAPESCDDAAWRFREACDVAGVRPVFYQVDASSLGRYVEMGMAIIKIGEDARVSLPSFTLKGSKTGELRRTKNKCEEMGLSFEVIPKAELGPVLPRLRLVSDSWLEAKSAGEKGFSLGFFDEDYLKRFDIAVVRDRERSIIAFANIWRSAGHEELSIDLMRHVPESPYGVMDYLFTELILYGQSQGYQWFDLGRAPLSGINARRLSPLWNQVSGLVFQHGGKFYNFKGLRSYKSKFGPKWFPKYLVCPNKYSTPQVLANVSTLVGGGIRKMWQKKG